MSNKNQRKKYNNQIQYNNQLQQQQQSTNQTQQKAGKAINKKVTLQGKVK